MTRVAPPGLNGQDDRPKGAEMRKVIVNELMSLDALRGMPWPS